MALTIDESNPCAAVATLRAVYANLVAGQSRETVTFRAGPNGVERSVTYQRADPARLLALIREYEGKCAQLSGQRPRRFGLRAGGRL